MNKHKDDYLEFLLNNCLVLFFQKFGCKYINCSHFIDEKILDNFLGENSEKEFYLATTKRKDTWYFLRPEMTYVSLLALDNLQNTMCCYSGFCFRHERKQFCRFREFLQFGVESVFSNLNKVRYVSYYLIFLTYLYLQKFVEASFLSKDVILDVFYANNEQKTELENVFNCFRSFFNLSEVNITCITRQGNGVTPYSGITFEYHVRHDAYGIHKEKHKYEFLGGGEYCYKKDKEYFGTGFGSGTKRLGLCQINYEQVQNFISNNIRDSKYIDLIINMNNLDMLLFVKNIIDFFKNINFNEIPNISLSFSKKYRYGWVFKDEKIILV